MKKTTISFKQWLLICATIIFCSQNVVQASHIMGGSIQYTNMGQNLQGNFVFNIKVYVYRYCEPGSAVLAQKLWLGAYSSSPNNLNVDTLTFQKKIPLVSLKTITPPNLSDTCAALLNVCVEEGIYEFDFALPPSQVGYNLIADVCCRNPNIVNLVNPANQGIAFFATIPPTNIVNNSPTYAIAPVPFLCTNDTNIVSNTVYDVDGDSLSYTFAWPFAGLGPFGAVNGLPVQYPAPIPKVVYTPGYGQFNPFGNNGYADIDSLNGLTTYYNPNTGFYVVSVFIREFRGGQQIGQYRRDLQLIFIPCPANQAPLLSNTQVFDYTINEGDTICIPMEFLDPDNDSIFLSHSGLMFDTLLFNPVATLNDFAGLGTDTATFCWATTCEAGNSNPYSFTVQVNDDGCPPKSNFYVFNINVIPVVTDALIVGPDTICNPQGGPFLFYVTNGDSTVLNNHWQVSNGTIQGTQLSDSIWVTNIANPLTVSFSEYGINGCESNVVSQTVVVGSNPQLTVSASDTSICEGDNTILTASGAINYSWYDNNSGIPFATGNTVTVSPTTTTTYTVVGTDSVECADIETITITVHPAATLQTVAGITSACPFLTGVLYYVINGNQNSTYTWTVNGGVLVSGQGNDSIIVDWGGVGTGSITVSELTQYGCPSAPITITVSITQNIIVPTGGPQDICIGNTGQVGTAAVGGFTYVWSPAFGLSSTSISNPFVNIQTIGTFWYTLTVNDSLGCSNTDSVSVTIHALPSVDILPANPDTICAGDTIILSGNGANTYTWYDINNPNVPIGNGSPFVVSPLVTTTYYTIGNDVYGCSDNDTITVFVHDPPPTAPNIIGNATSCANTTGILYYVSNSNPGFTYTWTVNGGIIVSGQGTDSIYVDWTTSGSGSVTVYETTDDGCLSQPITYNIQVTPALYVPVGPPQSICEQQSTTIGDFPIAGYTYVWSPPNGLSSTSISNPSLSITTAGIYTYYLFVSDTNGCENIDSVVIEVLAAPNISASAQPGTTICPYDTVTLSASGGLLYNWYMVGNAAIIGTGPSITITPSQSGQYYVVGNDGGICEGLDTVTVNVFPLSNLSVIGGDDTPCADTMGTVYYIPNSNGSSTYNWSVTGGSIISGQGTDTIMVLWVGTSGTITVTENDTNGCESLPVTLNVQQAAPVQAATPQGNNTVCETSNPQTYTCTVVGGGVYNWGVIGGNIAAGQGTNTISVNWNGAGTGQVYYTITATTDSVCYTPSDTLNIIITAAPQVTVSYNSPPPCTNDTAWFAAFASFATNYYWTTSGGVIVFGQNTDSIGVVFATAGTYTVTLVVDTGLCPSLPLTFNVNVGNATASISGNSILCDGQSTQLTATGTGTVFTWTPATGLSSTNVFDPVASPTTTTTYTVTVSNGSTCTATASITVTVNATPQATATAGNGNICQGGSTQLNGGGGGTYLWQPSVGLNDSLSANPIASPIVTTTYTLTVSNGNCVDTATVTINVSVLNVTATAANNTICEGQSTQLNANGAGINFAWSPAVGLSSTSIANPTASPTTATVYTVLVDDGAGCSATATVLIDVKPSPLAVASNDSTICDGTSIQLFAGGGITYAWLPAAGLNAANIPNPIATPLGTTSYTVTVTNADGCTATEEVIITVDNFVDADFTIKDSIHCDGIDIKFKNNSSNATSYQWIFGDGDTGTGISPTHSYQLGQNYIITLIAINGNCSDTMTTTYNTPNVDTLLSNIPNVITPNGDGLNDCYELGGLISYKECTVVEIYDRWGVLMFQSGIKNDCWEGTTRNGDPAPEGVYYLILKFNKLEYRGFVHVIRD